MTLADRRGVRILLSSTHSDAHTWNLVYLQLYCEELGHTVVNLGACVPTDLLVDQWRHHDPDVVVISSVNGHGFLDGLALGARVRSHPELAATPMVIGGMLGVDGAGGGSDVARRRRGQLLAAGFDLVLDEGDVAVLASYLARTRTRQVS